MNLSQRLKRREQDNNPIRIIVIGAGKFGCMFLAQAVRTKGMHVAAIVDIDIQRCRESLKRIGWISDRFGANNLQQAIEHRSTFITDRIESVVSHELIDVVIDATGNVSASVDHVLMAMDAGKHIVMVTVEADAVVGPILADKAKKAGVVYSMAYGDQPALICELVDWARSCGFEVTCAGKGTKYLPEYHKSTPDTVWQHYGFSEQQVASGDYNARMFNSFLDGTKSAIEMAAVANATGLHPHTDGLVFPPCAVQRLAMTCVPKTAGGVLEHSGTVEVVSSLYRDGSEIEHDLRWGVYVTFETDSSYVQRCFQEYGALIDPSGRYASLYRPTHLIGLELGYSVAKAVLLGEATGVPIEFNADVIAVAKRDLNVGERLDGEGGYTVYGRLVSAERSLEQDGLPLGLANDLTVTSPVHAGQVVCWNDVTSPAPNTVFNLRQQLQNIGNSSKRHKENSRSF
ncbi:MAG: Gfo/Idh/MocA family oxidoreductase [Arenicellales bacterium]|nr:Gfo/Idh/MocA family oxidoreductase [Arenicellales bacterium]